MDFKSRTWPKVKFHFFFHLHLLLLLFQIKLEASKIKLPRLPQGSYSPSGSNQKIYELCVCSNGKLFLSQAGSSSTCQINPSICLWKRLFAAGFMARQLSCHLILLEHRKPIKDSCVCLGGGGVCVHVCVNI